MEESNLFYQLKSLAPGAQQIGSGFAKAMPQVASISAIFAHNWDTTQGDSFHDHFYKALVKSGNDLSIPIASNSVIYGTITSFSAASGALLGDTVSMSKLKKGLAMTGGGLATIAGLDSVNGVYKALKNG
ncbi:hypothetical protein PsalN5692_00587 [Piscirickettsia salmonis]|uniref:hypothetical protein n=1 Tax=Piscirickettsia salmonis TaxID=1238 RepID=UPI0012B8AA69|nr:hypothetical protein [Piscirickettsia salmonis]QGP49165.1 hypothetical protein PsalN5692_00587 [Piscirickettsia salmonis]